MAKAAVKEYALRFPFRAVFSAVRRRVRGVASSRAFGPLLRLSGLKASKYVDAMTGAFDKFLSTSTDAANRTFWRNLLRLEKMAQRLPPEERQQVYLELSWRMQAVLAKEANAAEFLRRQYKRKLSKALESASEAVAKGKQAVPDGHAVFALEKFKQTLRGSNRALVALWKRFDQVVDLDHPGMLQALRRITKNVDSIRGLLKKRAFRDLDNKHLWKVRGDLGEAYALMSKAWLKETEKLLREAEELALKRGPGWTAVYMTQLEHAITIGGKEGPDAVIVLMNHNTGEVVLHAFAQVKIEKTVSAFEQIYRDFGRFIGQAAGSAGTAFGEFQFRLPSGISPPYMIVGGATLPKPYVLSAADSAASVSALTFLKDAGAAITEIKLDLTINQLSRLAINCIEAIVKYF